MLQISFWTLLLQGIYHSNMDTSTRLLSNKIIYNFVVVVYIKAFQIIYKYIKIVSKNIHCSFNALWVLTSTQ